MSQREKRKSTESTATEDSAGKRQRVIGPSLPPSHDSHSDNDSTGENESSDEDDFGPGLPPEEGVPGPGNSTSGEINHISPCGASLQKEHSEDSSIQRDDWMLRPPEAMDWASRVDPTKLKNRKFQTGKSATAPSEGKADSSWTETPEQKMKRLQDQVMGVSSHSKDGGRKYQSAASIEAMQHKLHRYREAKAIDNAADVNTSQQRRRPRGEEDDDDPSSRAFDREKDMSLSSKLTNSQRREVIGKAADFSSRFTSGKFL